MRGVWTARQIRDAEDVLGSRLPAGALMRRAAFGLAVHTAAELDRRVGAVAGRRVVLLVGAGDNGGDTLFAGALLRRRGVGVVAVLLGGSRTHAGGLAALLGAGGRIVDAGRDGAAQDTAVLAGCAAVSGADLVLDGIVGLSGRGGLRAPAGELVAAADRAGVPILAVDLPSGVDTDTGTVGEPAVAAAGTVTFGAHKPVHALAAASCGPVHLVDIGLEPLLPEPHAHVLGEHDVAQRWPRPGPADDKYTQGVVGVAAGSATYPGAAVLATGAAVLATSGMVRFAGGAAPGVRDHWPEVITSADVASAGRVQAWAVGPGIGTDDAGRAVLEAVLDAGVPVVVDADAITLLARRPALLAALHGRPVVLTPHDREFARLAGDVGDDRVAAARRAAQQWGVTVLLKGNATVVADPDGRALINPATSSWAATAGSGDVLTGLIGALLAAGLAPWWAAGCAARVHADAAQRAAAGAPAPASRLAAAIPDALRALPGW